VVLDVPPDSLLGFVDAAPEIFVRPHSFDEFREGCDVVHCSPSGLA